MQSRLNLASWAVGAGLKVFALLMIFTASAKIVTLVGDIPTLATGACNVPTECGARFATATANAYKYPARQAEEESGLDKVTFTFECVVPATYLNCAGVPTETVCKTGWHAVLDYSNGDPC